jgi:hypothetical protein
MIKQQKRENLKAKNYFQRPWDEVDRGINIIICIIC